MKCIIFLLFSLLTLLTSRNGLAQNQHNYTNPFTAHFSTGDTVTELGSSIMVIYQDRNNLYWFGSWETGVYRYDGKTLLQFTTKHGLLNNRVDEIKEDRSGNIYFTSANATSAISKYNGNNFTILTAVSSENWKLDSNDMWFKYSYGNTGKVYRYDGNMLFELKLPSPPNLSNPFDVYSIYKDRNQNIWFGTNPVGVCRYDGKSFQWITEEDVTEFRNEGSNGVRSILEDKNGDFWFNTEYRYRIYGTGTLTTAQFYSRLENFGSLDGEKDGNLDEYLSCIKDDNHHLWFVTYRDGVWKYDGIHVTHYPVQHNSQNIPTFSIYKDNIGDLWLGTHENGAYKFNGTAFEKFTP